MIFESSIKAGHGRGRLLGYPTLNLTIPQKLIKPHGIYAGWVWVEGKKHPGAFHFGPIPTFDKKTPSLEVFVLNKKIYGTPSSVKFQLTNRIRDIKTFSSPKQLTNQISKDVTLISKTLTQKNK